MGPRGAELNGLPVASAVAPRVKPAAIRLFFISLSATAVKRCEILAGVVRSAYRENLW